MGRVRYNKTENAVRNSIYGIVLRVINLVGAFIVRTMLIHIMGMEFVGLDGLFSSVLQFLNLAELGFSSAIVFKLYRPMAEQDDETVCALLTYYRSIYRIIGVVILVVGSLIIPVLPKLISGTVPEGVSIYVLYMVYLLNTCLSYWLFAYRTAILSAAQRNDLSSKISSVVLIFKYVLQIVLLLVVKSYYIYVIVIPVTTVLTNIGNMLITNKYFPQYRCKGELNPEDKKEINQKVAALMYNKLGVVLINGSQNIVVSSVLGLALLGIYNSYYYIFNMLYSFFDVFHAAITGGIGNSIVTESKETNYTLFGRVGFVNNWIVGWCSICLLCLYKPFMLIWVGEEHTLSHGFSLLMSLYFYLWMVRYITAIFKSAQGLWVEDRFRALIEGVCNLLLSLVLVQHFGLSGVVLATIAAQVVISLPWETHVLFSKYFECPDKLFYHTFLGRFAVTVVAGGATFFLCNCFVLAPIPTLLIDAVLCVFVPNAIFFAFYRKTDEFGFLLEMITKVLKIQR